MIVEFSILTGVNHYKILPSIFSNTNQILFIYLYFSISIFHVVIITKNVIICTIMIVESCLHLQRLT